MKKRILVLLTVVALMVLAMAVAPAFAQTDIQGVTFGGNCLVNDFVELCDINTGMGGL
jgi:hypothetical protein